MTTRSAVRVLAGLVVAAGLAAAVLAWRAGTSSAQSNPPGSTTACPAVGGGRIAVGCTYPVWCCSNGSLPGVTVTGQAMGKGTSSQVRQQAIARAVADARQQAEAAAGAAGVKLGRVIDMQVSSFGSPYAIPAGAAATASGDASARGPASSPLPGVVCSPSEACPPPGPVETFVSVTVTWAIA